MEPIRNEQNIPSMSKVEHYPSGNGFTVYEEVRDCEGVQQGTKYHNACMEAKVWEWPWYKGGACEVCEKTFEELWQEHAVYLENELAGLMHHVGIGRRHHDCTIENFSGSEAIRAVCKEIVKNPADLVLSGSPGTGKTHLAAAIVRELILAGKVFRIYDPRHAIVEFITVPDLFLKLRQSFNDAEAENESEILSRLSKIALLVLDDLGSEKPTEWAITTLYTIIDARYREMKPTIVTTNLSLEKIGSQLHDRIASRLSSGKVIKLKGVDHRAKRPPVRGKEMA